MLAEIVTFPSGGAEGLPVLRLDFEDVVFDPEEAEGLVAQVDTVGLWGLWIDAVLDWSDPKLCRYLTNRADESMPVVAIRKLGARDWPAYGVNFVLDASGALAETEDLDELADYLSARASSHPVVEDLIATLPEDKQAPRPGMLDMLMDFARPRDFGYLYIPDNYRWRPLVLKNLSSCASTWALRRL